jgi:hypothetical protein
VAFEQKDNSGAIFKNKNPKNDKSPPLTGNAMIGGVEYWISAWSKTDKNGEKWISLAVNPKNPSAAQTQTSKAVERDTSKILDDDIPFD